MLRGRFTMAAILVLVLSALLAAQATRPEPNAAEHYRQASEAKMSREALDVLFDYQAHPLDETVDRVLREHAQILDHLHRGAAIARCDWKVAGMQNPGSFSDVQELAILRARKHASEKRWQAAFDDITATMVLGRHIASHGDWLSRLVGDATVSLAANRAGPLLLDAPAKNVDAFLQRLDHLPPQSPPAELVPQMVGNLLAQIDHIDQHPEERKRLERAGRKLDAIFNNAGIDTDLAGAIPAELWEDPKARDRLRSEIRQHAPAADRVLQLPAKDWEKARDEELAALAKSHNITRSCFKAAFHVREGQDYADAQLRLLRAAVAYQRGGAPALSKCMEPLTGQPPKLEAHDGGFTLTSPVKRLDRPATLTVGKPKDPAR